VVIEKPAILWLPAHSDNINVRPGGIMYEALVVHTTAGGKTVEQLGAWFGGGNIAAGLRGSTHYGVGTDGRISQHVQLWQQPIAHGQESGSTEPLVIANGTISANAWAIGCETLDGGVPGSCTEPQFQAIVHLFAWLWQTEILPHAAKTGAKLDRDHVLRHSELAPRSKPLCPSWPEERMKRLMVEMQRMLDSARPEPEPAPDPRDERIRRLEEHNRQLLETNNKLDVDKIGLRDAYTASVGSFDAFVTMGRTLQAQAEEAARSARKKIQQFGD
jgi:hypothetical protein